MRSLAEHRRLRVSNRRKKIKNVLLVSGGNFLDMYDFMVFGYYAPWISRAYFPKASEFASLLLTFAVFGAGFLMRPLGGLVLGAYVDRRGRRAGQLMTLGLMAVGTLSIACTPGYATLGVLAPILVLLGRLLQGFSAGAQLGSVSVYLSEIATPGHEGFYVSWQSASQQIAVVFAALLGITVSSHLSPSAFASWGWRLPFFVGCLIIPFIFLVHSSLEESPTFLLRKPQLSTMQVFRKLAQNWRLITLGAMLVTMTTVAFYLITAYTPTYGNVVLHLSPREGLIVTLCVGVSNFVMLPIMGALSDRIGRRPLLLSCALLMLLSCYPAMSWLVGHPSFTTLLAVELWLSFLYSGYNGAMVVYLTEIIPTEVRTAGFSLAYSLATAIFGGFTPAISTYLIHFTGNKAMPGVWLSFAAVCAVTATLVTRTGDRARRLGYSVAAVDL
ncbi:MFS transporter [Edaphobacter sp. HDX4]|uniref:MFS transporter n=1 Tax=Edaphobacter sp. HDX4 TaxID=2794064 RepID=UPI002FE58119